jgi:PAS domain S-box-containing protein
MARPVEPCYDILMAAQSSETGPSQYEPTALDRRPSGAGGLFLAMAALLIVTLAGTFYTEQRATYYAHEVTRSHQTVDSLRDLMSSYKDAETGQRGFLLTGNPSYLSPYTSAIGLIPTQLADLDQRAADGLLDPADVDRLRRLGDRKLAELKQAIDLRQSPKGLSAAQPLVMSNVGENTMSDIRALVHHLILQKEQQTSDYEHHAAIASYVRTAAFAGTTIINLLFLQWAYKRIRREIAQRQAANENLSRQQQLTAVTLASIGDGVIVTDAAGKITFMNQVALKLTGWQSVDALGQPCGAVFNIINETTRQPVPNPIDNVLKSGLVQGLANHTLLIRKDGKELPIDDCGSPIRGDDGVTHGAVLVFRDFSDRREYEQNLKLAKDEAEAANVAKDNFLAVLSHELRTPLTPVLVALTAWEQSSKIPPELSEDVPTLRRCVELEARLIDDLLDLTRIIRGKLILNFEVADVHDLIQAVANMYRSDLDAKSIHVSLHLGAVSHYANVDPGRIQQVFWNILKNAAKFTPVGGSIDISSSNVDSNRIQIKFKDSGVGMTQATLQRIFQPFEQGSAELVRRYGGLGLGLSLSKAFVEAQGGSISATSAGPGKGSIFTVSVPYVTAPAKTPRGESPTPNSPPSGKHLEILLVEDHDDTARVLSRLLEKLGHHVHIADSVASALSQSNQHIDLLLSDIGLPDGSGNDIIRKLRARDLQIPAVALTGFGMEEDIIKSREAGFTDHLTKPVNFQRLQMMVQKIADSL